MKHLAHEGDRVSCACLCHFGKAGMIEKLHDGFAEIRLEESAHYGPNTELVALPHGDYELFEVSP